MLCPHVAMMKRNTRLMPYVHTNGYSAQKRLAARSWWRIILRNS